MTGDPVAASHLADLDARFESHLGALRLRAEQFRRTLAAGAAPAPAPHDAPVFPADDFSWQDPISLT